MCGIATSFDSTRLDSTMSGAGTGQAQDARHVGGRDPFARKEPKAACCLVGPKQPTLIQIKSSLAAAFRSVSLGWWRSSGDIHAICKALVEEQFFPSEIGR